MQKLMEEMEKTRLHMEQQGLWKHGAFGNPDMVKFADGKDLVDMRGLRSKAKDVADNARSAVGRASTAAGNAASALMTPITTSWNVLTAPDASPIETMPRELSNPAAPAASPKEQSGN